MTDKEGFAPTEREAWRAEVDHLHETIDKLASETVRLRAALKVHHDLGLWSLGHETCPECGQSC